MMLRMKDSVMRVFVVGRVEEEEALTAAGGGFEEVTMVGCLIL